jgi:predicted metal-dependent hydrolase
MAPIINRLIRTKRKTIALIVETDGSLTVRAPLRVSNKSIFELVEQKSGWIQRKQESARSFPPASQMKAFTSGETFWYLGKAYPLEIVPDGVPALQLDGKFYLARSRLPKAGAIFTRWYKDQAARTIEERAGWYAARFRLPYKQIKITSARGRWGSCSARDTLCFTWRLVMAPPEIIDYVIVHELVHLEEKNHSKNFWAKVEAILPDYLTCRKWLRQNGYLLGLEFL